MASTALNIRLPAHGFPISVSRSSALFCGALHQGTDFFPIYLRSKSFPIYLRSKSCSSFSDKKLKALCVSSKLIESGRESNPPPSSKEEAVKQVRECLSTLLEKPLKNLGPSVKQQKKQRQVRLRIELPIIDDSLSALASLVAEILGGFSVKKKGQPTKISIFWSNSSMRDLGNQVFEKNDYVTNLDFSDPDIELGFVEDSDVLFFVTPGILQLASIELICKEASPRPVVLFNPNWSVDEESDANNGFLSSFEPVYSFTALAIQGFFSKSEGAVFRYVKGGAPSSNPWLLFVKEEGKYNCLLTFKRRPNPSELENALYNSLAANSPVTKSVRFLRNLISRPDKKK